MKCKLKVDKPQKSCTGLIDSCRPALQQMLLRRQGQGNSTVSSSKVDKKQSWETNLLSENEQKVFEPHVRRAWKCLGVTGCNICDTTTPLLRLYLFLMMRSFFPVMGLFLFLSSLFLQFLFCYWYPAFHLANCLPLIIIYVESYKSSVCFMCQSEATKAAYSSTFIHAFMHVNMREAGVLYALVGRSFYICVSVGG